MLSLHISEIITAIVYFGLLISIGITFRSFSSDADDYLRAGCRGTWWLVGASTFMASFTAMTFVAISGQAFVAGWSVLLITFTGCLGPFLHAAYFAPKYRQLRVVSGGDVMVTRFGRAAEQFVSYYWIISGMFGASLALVGTATFVSTVFGLRLDLLIIGVGLVITVYSSCSGTWGVLATDFVQGSVLVPVSIAVTVLALLEVGGVTNMFDMINQQGLSEDFALLKPAGYVYKTPVKIAEGLFTPGWLCGLLFLQIAGSTSLGARYISVKDGKEARKAALFVGIMLLFGALIWYIPPVVGRLIYYNDIMAVKGIPNVADAAYAVVSSKLLPTGLIGLMAMAILAATMSSLDSSFNGIAALVVRNIYPPLAAALKVKEVTDPKKLLIMSRCVNAIYGSILVILGLCFTKFGMKDGLYSYMLIMMALIGFPSVIPMFMAMFVRKTPAWSYFLSMGMGIIGSSFCFFAPKINPSIKILWHEQLFLIGALGIAGWLLSAFFWKRCSPEYRARVEEFYARMNRPVDFAKEVGTGNDFRQFKMVGLFVMIAGGLLMFLLLVPNPLRGRMTILTIALFVLLLGFLLYRLGVRSFKKINEAKRQDEKKD